MGTRPPEERVEAPPEPIRTSAHGPLLARLRETVEPRRLRRIDTRATEPSAQKATRRQGDVANDFRLQSQPSLPGEKEVLRIHSCEVLPETRRLPVDCRRDDQPLQGLDVPATPHELARQPVEKPRVGRWYATHAEVVLGRHEADTE